MGDLQPWHIIVLLVVVFLLFGAKRMPDMARSVGQSLRIFKSEMRQGAKENEEAAKAGRRGAAGAGGCGEQPQGARWPTPRRRTPRADAAGPGGPTGPSGGRRGRRAARRPGRGDPRHPAGFPVGGASPFFACPHAGRGGLDRSQDLCEEAPKTRWVVALGGLSRRIRARPDVPGALDADSERPGPASRARARPAAACSP